MIMISVIDAKEEKRRYQAPDIFSNTFFERILRYNKNFMELNSICQELLSKSYVLTSACRR